MSVVLEGWNDFQERVEGVSELSAEDLDLFKSSFYAGATVAAVSIKNEVPVDVIMLECLEYSEDIISNPTH